MKCGPGILVISLIVVASYAQPKTAEDDHYLFPEFIQGIVLLKTGKNDPKLLNYNSLAEQLVFDNGAQILAVPNEQLVRIDTVYIQERKFIVLNNRFVELLHHSDWDLYVEHKCHLKEQGKDAGFGGTSHTSAINNPSAVRLGGSIYNVQLPDGFEAKRYFVYWLKRGRDLNEVINLKQMRKLYKDKSDLFNQYIKDHAVKYEDQESVMRLIGHLESN